MLFLTGDDDPSDSFKVMFLFTFLCEGRGGSAWWGGTEGRGWEERPVCLPAKALTLSRGH